MTGSTTFLNLTTYDSTSDGSSLFLTFRNDMAGSPTTSNMNLIDTFAFEINGSIIDLQAEQPIYSITGSYASPNNYGATSATLLSYETNQMLSLKLDTENDGTVGLRVNELDTITLKKFFKWFDRTAEQTEDILMGEPIFRAVDKVFDGIDDFFRTATGWGALQKWACKTVNKLEKAKEILKKKSGKRILKPKKKECNLKNNNYKNSKI